MTQAPDADLTWLSTASPYVWNVNAAGVQAAAQSAVDAYPDEPEELALAIVGGPDTLDADLAARLLEKMAEDRTLASRMDRLIAELKLVSLVVRTLARRGELTDARWDLAVSVTGRDSEPDEGPHGLVQNKRGGLPPDSDRRQHRRRRSDRQTHRPARPDRHWDRPRISQESGGCLPPYNALQREGAPVGRSASHACGRILTGQASLEPLE
ncbi:MAG: hypothetical protein KL785_05790 [Brevundimonas sp.]|nr:hypothetical protein [Brevundimonas sp.]